MSRVSLRGRMRITPRALLEASSTGGKSDLENPGKLSRPSLVVAVRTRRGI